MESGDRTIKGDTMLALLDLSRWTRILAVMIITGFVIGVLFFLLFLYADLADIRALNNRAMNGVVIFYAVVVVVSIAAHIYPFRQLIAYRKHIRIAVETEDSSALHRAVLCIRNLFRYVVLATAIGFGIYLLIGLLAMLLL